MIPYNITEDSVTVLFNGMPEIVPNTHPNYDRILTALRNKEWIHIPTLINIPKAVQTYSHNRVEVRNGVVFYQNQPLHNAVTAKVLRMMREPEKYDVDPMLKFLDRLMNNPSKRSVDQFYTFIEQNNLVIDPEGFVLLYKGVRSDYKDCHSGTFDNSVGSVNEMVRNQVDDNPNAHCSFGFHVGGYRYVQSFGVRKMLVKVDPADVVSVPTDSNCTKIRVCKYEVIGEVDADKFRAEEPYKKEVEHQITLDGVTYKARRDEFGDWVFENSDMDFFLDTGTKNWSTAMSELAETLNGHDEDPEEDDYIH